jgi:hypothetical protein
MRSSRTLAWHCELYKTLDNCALFDEEKKTPANHPRFFPFAYRYPVVAGDFSTTVEFEYLCPLQPDQSTCITFHAITKGSNPKEVVVKFVQGLPRFATSARGVDTKLDKYAEKSKILYELNAIGQC